jgi:hypothetical protein
MVGIDRPATEKSQLTELAAKITGTTWCGYHQGYADADKGQFLQRSGKRWMCGNCLIRRGIVSA